MKNRVIETVIFKLKAEASDDAFLKAAQETAEKISNFQGFIARRLSQGADGTWIEHIEWANMDDAKMASDLLMKDADMQPFLEPIDLDTVKLTHTNVTLSVG